MTRPADRSPFTLWLDLETTGNDLKYDDVIEVGAILTVGPGYSTVASFQHVYCTNRKIINIDPTVVEMHAENGLWREVCSAKTYASSAAAESEFVTWLEGHKALKKPLPLAGSGIAHFDRPIIRRIWPLLDTRLAHGMYDIGIVRRFLGDWDALPPNHARSAEIKSHRALDDARQHLTEALELRAHVTS